MNSFNFSNTDRVERNEKKRDLIICNKILKIYEEKPFIGLTCKIHLFEVIVLKSEVKSSENESHSWNIIPNNLIDLLVVFT